MATDRKKQTYSEAATKMVFQNICSFFLGVTFFTIFQEGLSVRQTDMFFPGRSMFKQTFFQGGSICLSNRPYYLVDRY